MWAERWSGGGWDGDVVAAATVVTSRSGVVGDGATTVENGRERRMWWRTDGREFGKGRGIVQGPRPSVEGERDA